VISEFTPHNKINHSVLAKSELYCSIPIPPLVALLFTGWHELSHHLFKEAQNGDLEAFLFECTDGNHEKSRDLEENLCFKAAALLLMPTHILNEVVMQSSYSPIAVFELADRTGASIEAAMRRVIWSRSINISIAVH
jgi:Zn-dependent peptidase ImmA (M78 family)